MRRRGEAPWGGGPPPWAGRGGRSEPPPADDASAWLAGALPDDWFTGPVDVTIDRDEILIVGELLFVDEERALRVAHPPS